MKYKFFFLVLVVLMMGLLSGMAVAQEGNEEVEAIIANDDWEPVVQGFDGVEMVLVPPGCFMMGSTDEQIDAAFAACEEGGGAVHQGVGGQCERGWYTDEQPSVEICFDEPFWIDRYEVTNGQFELLSGQAERDSRFTDDNQPLEQVTWFEARDFCESRGSRLPTEPEWEYTARGPDNLIFPWGNEFVAENVVFLDNSDNQTGEVGLENRPDGVSWVGAYDLVGNVWEWVSSLYRDYPYNARNENVSDVSRGRTIRGNSWDVQSFFLQAAGRSWIEPDYSDEFGGFRCARDYETDD